MDLETAEVPLFQQTRVRFKMRQFHSRLKSVCVPTCVTCLESFPGMNVRTVSVSSDDTECLRCARDKHTPKIYSSANNMDPGSVPSELMVSSCSYDDFTSTLYYVLISCNIYRD